MLLLPVLVHACDLPVFRWALENWAADPYEIVIFHDAALTESQSALVDTLRGGTTEQKGLANARTTVVDTRKAMEPLYEDLLAGQEAPETPWIVLRYPHALPNPAYVWSGGLSAENISSILDSPARQEIVRRLGEETTAVWVFLNTGDVKRDAGRLEDLEPALKAMSKTFEIKPLDIDTNEDAEPVPWDLKFSALSIDRNDPAEQPFIQMLLKSEGDLSGIDAPMAFPVFARGRALYALVDGGISANLVEDACMYIAGRCTCEVKDQNPGIDLLMSANWDEVVGESMMAPIEPPSAAELTAVQVAAVDPALESPTAETPVIASPDQDKRRAMVLNIAMAMAIGFILVIGGTLFLLFKKANGDN